MARLWPLAVVLAVLAMAARASAADSLAPPGALPNWLPNEQWVYEHYLPYDEQRLYDLLGTTRGAIWRHLRDDQAHNLAELAHRRGLSAQRLAAALVAPRRAAVSARELRVLRARALRTLTQGHLSQHMLFHSMHQWAIPGRSKWIFGIDESGFFQLRLADLSPIGIARLYGHDAVLVRRRALSTLRSAARTGVSQGDVSARQAALLLDRQVRQLPRWLGQGRDNGPPPMVTPSTPLLPVGDFANHPSISRDGSRVAWDAYRAKIPDARRRGEIRVVVSNVRTGRRVEASRTAAPRPGIPRSAYNSALSADGRSVVFEASEGNLNFGKRYGSMWVVMNDIAHDRSVNVSNAPREPVSSGSAYNPSVSGDGQRVVFESTDQSGSGRPKPMALWVFDRAHASTQLIAQGSFGATYEPRISADGGSLVFSDASAGRDGRVEVYARSLQDGNTVLVSRANGSRGAVANGDSSQPTLSADGRFVAFASAAANLGATGRSSRIFVRDLQRNTTKMISGGTGVFAFDPAISTTGRYVVFASRPAGRNGRPSTDHSSVWLNDLRTGRTSLVSRANGARGRSADGMSTQPTVSADGQVAFTSTAGSLDPDKAPGLPGIFLRDTRSSRTTLLSTHAPRVATARIAALCHLG
ncbi:MAG: hypothetical protein ACXVHK_29690 [Solirubrobacteraceae bacterium]